MNVRLSPELEDLVREKVETGLCRDETEVIAEALRLLDRFDHSVAGGKERLREALRFGLEDIAEGRFTSIDDEDGLRKFFDEL
jgi:antitoxin ParD1/3/4